MPEARKYKSVYPVKDTDQWQAIVRREGKLIYVPGCLKNTQVEPSQG